ncbi:T6SS immunity protein Tli4 family protein [Cupriavidus campinensis]
MKDKWVTRAIGRHLIDTPPDSTTIEIYKFNEVSIEYQTRIVSRGDFDKAVSAREQELRGAKHNTRGSMFVEKIPHSNGAVTIVSWNKEFSVILYLFDTYFHVGNKTIKYSGTVSPKKSQTILDQCDEMAREWHEIPPGEIPTGIGFVAGDVILADRDFNPEHWQMLIKLNGKPDAWLKASAYAQWEPEPSLRDRAGGVVASLLTTVAGFERLRSRSRPVGPIEADEILLAGTQNGKRVYGFKWEAPGKAQSLAEPNLNLSLDVRESAYLTNNESFASDEEALELWDAIVDSIRLRPGAV